MRVLALFLGMDRLPQDTVLDLCAALKVETFVPNEVIFAENTACDRLYILDRGVVWNRGRICACLPSKRLCNQWIGIQDAYSFAGLHRSPAHALTYCVVFSLRNEVLEV